MAIFFTARNGDGGGRRVERGCGGDGARWLEGSWRRGWTEMIDKAYMTLIKIILNCATALLKK